MASNRRKRPFPVRLNNEEQEKLAWNMTDLMKNNGVAKPGSLFHDAPSCSGLEHFTEENKVEQIPRKRGRFMAKRNSNCDEIVELKLQSSSPDCWHCIVGSFGVSYSSSKLSQTASTLLSDEKKTFPEPCANMTEVKVTLNMESIVDNEMGNDFITEDISTKECLPCGLRTLSMKGFTNVPLDTLASLENLQKNGVALLVINPKTSVFDDSWEIDVCLCEKALSKMMFASQDVMMRNNDKLIQKLMKFFFIGVCDNGSERVEYWDKETEFTSLYETVMRRREEKWKMKSGKMETFVASSKTVDESCKIGNVCTSEINMSDQDETRNCENYEENLHKCSSDESYFNFENKDAILDSERQSKQKPVFLEDDRMPKPMEVQAECEHDCEVTGFLDSKPLRDFQHEHLKPTLRQYQRRAIQWMIDKENRSDWTKATEGNNLHVLWRRCVTLDKKVIFFNPYNGRLTTEHFKPPELPPGGILADEMGLGKTVEVLACILNNPMPGGKVPKNDKPTVTVEPKATLEPSLEHLAESESTIPLRELVNPSGGLSQKNSTQEETLCKEVEQILPCQIAPCSPPLFSSSVPQLFATPVSSCTSDLASATIAPPSIESSKMPEIRSSAMTPLDACTISYRASKEMFPFPVLSQSAALCSLEVSSVSMSHLSSFSPCTPAGPSETMSKVPEQMASFSSLSTSSASCSLEYTPTCTVTTALVTSSVIPCTSEGPSETMSKVPEQMASFSSLSPSSASCSLKYTPTCTVTTSSVASSAIPCTSEGPSETMSKVPEQMASFSSLSPSSASCSLKYTPTCTVTTSSVASSAIPCTSEGPSETMSKVPEQVASFSSLSPSSASCSLKYTPTCTPTTALVASSAIPCTREGPYETMSKVPEQMASFSSLLPSSASCSLEYTPTCTLTTALMTSSAIPCTSEGPSDIRAPPSMTLPKLPEVLSGTLASSEPPSTQSTATAITMSVVSSTESLPFISMVPSGLDTALVSPSMPSVAPAQLVASPTALQYRSLTESRVTPMPSPPSTSTPVVISSSSVPSSLLTTQQKVSSALQSTTSEATVFLQPVCMLPTLSVCPSKPSQNYSHPSTVHSNHSSGSETAVAKSRDVGLVIEKWPQESDLLDPKELREAESSNHPSSLQCHENSTDKNGQSPKLSWESVEPVSNTKSVIAKTALITKDDQLVDRGTRQSPIDTASRRATLAIKCICGSTRSSVDDVLLKCTECSAVSHASCLGHSVACHQTQAFLCPNCAVNRPPIPSRATLIISPATIAHQWVEEITRHTTPSSLRLLVYEGVAKQGFVQPDMLADHDVILTTYATLRADFHHLGTQHGRLLRSKKRYMALPSPLTAIKFWRICLDEAQMVESTTAKAAEMALRLDCVNRWCVTGTPIQKGLEDLYGLFLFLGVYPYCQKVWWNRLLYQPYLGGDKEPMYNALADILWRTAKKDVLDEIHLPSQTEVVVRLNFTPVEEHFYRRQHEECSASINLILKRFGSQDVKLNSLDRNTVHKMLIPLLRLRQACCHPQVVRGGFLSIQKSTMTMDQLLEVLITRAKVECEEVHRQLLFAINGLAGVHAIKEEWPETVDLYRQSMQSWMEHEDKFRTDALQKLHTLHNLSDLLSAAHPGCSRTLRDDKLKDEADELVKQYMLKPSAQVRAAQDNLTVTQTNIEELLKKVQFHSPWWLRALDSVDSSGLGHELVNRVREELSAVSTDHSSILNSFTDIHGLGFTVTTKLDVVESTHSTLIQALEQLRSYPTPEMVYATAMCCLRSRPHRTSQATRCKFCEVDDIFTEYESRLFGHQGMKGIIEEEEATIDWHRHGNTGGLRAETETEKVLKTLFAFIKSHRLVPSVHQDARNHLAFMEARRKEFKSLRSVWFASRERVSSLDELEMCTTKLRLALPGETVNENENHVIQLGQVEQQKLKFISDRIIARSELRKKLGQYLYLTNLAKNQKFNEGENPDPCPVCTKSLGKEWSVFSCGHCYCCQCVWVLLRQAGIGPRNRDVHIKCPICRFPTLAREISYVCTGKEGNDGDKSVSVKGSHSTKVEAVVRALLKIKAKDETAKCLVFSTWQDVLELIGKALQENDITFRHITSGGKRFQTNLHVFKEDPSVPVLLLPLQSGSNGLNIIEATHVLLVEPALNPAHELQAVGRVHRIGQTRPTFVHRFIINNTVESRMHSLLTGKSRDVVRTGSKDTENSALTIADLTSLFKEGNDANQMEIGSDMHDDIVMIT